MSFRKIRMIEVSVFVMGHTDSLHDVPRTKISYGSEGHDFFETDSFKTESQGRTGSFLRIPITPMIERQSPTNLNTGRKRKLIARNIEADESDELFGCFHFGSPKSKSIAVNSSFDLR